MHIEYVPLLRLQRELHELPRSFERFERYLRVVFDRDRGIVEIPPMVIMNPMGKEHVAERLDDLLALDADAVAAQAVADAAAELVDERGEFKLGLVIVDDLMGAWTNRYATEFNLRFGGGPPAPVSEMPAELPRWAKHAWITAPVWSSEPVTGQVVREAVLTAVHRTAYVQRHGRATTLREMLAQEGQVLSRAGCAGPSLDDDEIDYTRDVLDPLLGAGDMRTAVECLFGDVAAESLGFTQRGLSPSAGLALALHDARAGVESDVTNVPPPPAPAQVGDR
jgi:hypothetical protein